MNGNLTNEQIKIIDAVAVEHGFEKYKLITNPASSKGGNFLGVLTAVSIKDDNKQLELILKSVFNDEKSKSSNNPIREAYRREIYVYLQIFKSFKRFEKENNIVDPFSSTTKLYSCSDLIGSECLIMENLKAEGYHLWDKTVPMNPGHIKAVLVEYAKFHGISLAMNHKQPTLFKELTGSMTKNMMDNTDMCTAENLNPFISSLMKRVYDAVDGNNVLTDFLKKIEPKFVDLFVTESRKEDYQCVVDHGDCWCNNFMFKYQNPQSIAFPTSVRIIDWQLSRLNSPASDFCYFFLLHSSKETFNEYKSYEEIYYNTLCDRLRNFNCDPEKVFPYNKWKKHCNLYMQVQMFLSFSLLKIMLGDSDEAPNISNKLDDCNEIVKEMDYDIKNLDLYKERVKNIVEFMVANNFSS